MGEIRETVGRDDQTVQHANVTDHLIHRLEDGTFTLSLWPCRADVLRYLFSPDVPIVWLRRHMPSESFEWWTAEMPLIRGGASMSLRVRCPTFDIEMPTPEFLSRLNELNEHGIEVFQLSSSVPDSLTLDAVEPGAMRRVLIQNGCTASFHLPHAGEMGVFWTADRGLIESALAHEPVARIALPAA